MGIAKGALALLYELKTTEALQGSVCQLGRQTCFVSPAQVTEVGQRFGFKAPALEFRQSPQAASGIVDDVYLFKALGFDQVESMDASDYEAAAHVHDLNLDVPEALYERFDFIYDGGTLEHVFDFPNCLRNIYKMLKPGGIVMHALPSNNHVDHGFYQFSPTLFYDYYTANHWQILRANIYEYTPDHDSKPWLVYDYLPGSIDHLSFGRWGSNMLGLWFVARKAPEARCDINPMQGTYLRVWQENTPESAAAKTAPQAAPAPQGLLGGLKQVLKTNKLTYGLALKLFLLYRKAARKEFPKPRLIAKY